MRRLMTHPGVGALTALAFVLIIGTPERFACGKQIAAMWDWCRRRNPAASRRQLGHISKQGNALLRFLLVEAAQATVRSDPDWRRSFCTWPCGGNERSPRSRWHASSRSASTGCGGRVGLRAVEEVRFARGTARKSPWCEVDHRRNDWASRSPSTGEFEEVIMIASCDRRDGWVGLSSWPERLRSEPRLGRRPINESEMARSSECSAGARAKVLDTADIVREAIYQQLRRLLAAWIPVGRPSARNE